MKLRVQRFVPDLAIEIVSPDDMFEELATKAQRYRACGTQEVWMFSIEASYIQNNGELSWMRTMSSARNPSLDYAIRIGDLLDRY
jgi:Uma2 family endonuclease